MAIFIKGSIRTNILVKRDAHSPCDREAFSNIRSRANCTAEDLQQWYAALKRTQKISLHRLLKDMATQDRDALSDAFHLAMKINQGSKVLPKDVTRNICRAVEQNPYFSDESIKQARDLLKNLGCVCENASQLFTLRLPARHR